TDAKVSADDKQLIELFGSYLPAKQSALKGLAEAMEDEKKEIRRMAIDATGAIGEVDYVVPALGKADDPTSRRAAIPRLPAPKSPGPGAAKPHRSANPHSSAAPARPPIE